MKENMEGNKALDLQELQKVNLELLEEFDEICRKYAIRYDICGGTLLGAVRHHGFIPWDDDVDVSMPRPEYERLYELYLDGKITLPDERALISNKDRSFARHYGRYVRKDIIKEAEYTTENENPYVGIDIFVVDGISTDNNAVISQIKKIWFLRKLLLIKLSKPGTSSRGKAVAVAKRIVRGALKPIKLYSLIDKMDRLCRETDYDRAERLGCLNGMYPLRDQWEKADYIPQAQFEFEGKYFSGFQNYDIYLKNLYGDYMQLPPKDKRVIHPFKAYYINRRK